MSAITRHEMPNGATVSDWLGTASLAAMIAAGKLQAVREGNARDEGHSIADAHADLQKALRECGEIMQALEDAGLATMA